MTVQIAPSIIAADYLGLGGAVSAIEDAADLLHVDIMDGHFVPNLTIGPGVVEALRRASRLPLDVHLMIEDPDRYLETFAGAGASRIIVHVEAVRHLHRTITSIRALGLTAGVALNPATPASFLSEVLTEIDGVLVMTVNPGFSGQTFIARSPSKVAEVRRLLDLAGSRAWISVDGGVDASNAGALVAAGATVLVAGTSVFGAPDPAKAVGALREAARQPA
jgi:ribulose-phosphate 3-epimerase